MKKIGINGFGRIGRLALRIIMEKYSDQLEVPIINTSGKMDAAGWAYLFEFDTAYRRFHGSVESDGDFMIINDRRVYMHGDKDPANIPWGDYGVETVIDSTGAFRDSESLSKHLRDGVSRVILSAPAKDETIQTVVLGINDQDSQGKQIINNASCTTNCVAPVTQVILEKFGINKAALTTVHSYTSDQSLHDGSHKDLRRSRAAAASIIPTTTGAAIATTQVIPELAGKLDGMAIRVPSLVGSLTDFTFVVNTRTSVDEVNAALTEASESDRFKHYLWVTKKPIVSADVIGCEASALVDLSLTMVVDGDLVKVLAWYDNEWGYANRLVEQLLK